MYVYNVDIPVQTRLEGLRDLQEKKFDETNLIRRRQAISSLLIAYNFCNYKLSTGAIHKVLKL